MPDISDFYRGDTRTFEFTFKDSSDVAIDITGWKIWLTLKTNGTDTDASAIMQVSTTVGDHVDDVAASGLVYLVASSTDTAVDVGTYNYDFQRTITGSPPDVRTILAGKVKVLQDITTTDTTP